jgi:hypothetical protein
MEERIAWTLARSQLETQMKFLKMMEESHPDACPLCKESLTVRQLFLAENLRVFQHKVDFNSIRNDFHQVLAVTQLHK